MIPAESQTVTTSAPAAAAVSSNWHSTSGSARVASRAENSTCSVWYRARSTRALASSSMAGAFLWHRYSIWTAEAGSMMCREGFRAPRMLSQAASTLSAVSPAAAETRAEETTEAMVLLLRASDLASPRGGSSMASTWSRSRERAISTRSLKLSVPARPASRRVTSEI